MVREMSNKQIENIIVGTQLKDLESLDLSWMDFWPLVNENDTIIDVVDGNYTDVPRSKINGYTNIEIDENDDRMMVDAYHLI